MREYNRMFLSGRVMLAAVALIAALVILPAGAYADTLSVTASCGSASTVTLSGNVFSGTCGSFIVAGVAVGTPPLNEPNLLTNSLDINSGGAGTLTLNITESGITTLSGLKTLLSGFTNNFATGLISEVFLNTYVNGNLLDCSVFGGTSSGCETGTLFTPSATSSVDVANFTGSDTVTAQYIIVTTGSGSANESINLTMPEPASLSMVGIGLLTLGAGLRRKLANKASVA